jgi:hypothetical protein
MWTKHERETQPRYAGGVDWGSERDVLLRKGPVCVVKSRGSTGWTQVGCSGYHPPSWYLQTGPRYAGHEYLRSEGRVTNQMWTSWLPKIAAAMGLPVEAMPPKMPRGCTLVWEEERAK